MLSPEACRQLFMITDNTCEQLAFKVLAKFELSRGTISFHGSDLIQFQVYGKLWWMSLTDFFNRLWLYDAEFTRTPAYDSLLISKPIGESQEDTWRRLNTDPAYGLCQSKASTLHSPALRYIHCMVSHTLIGQGESARVVSQRDFDFLLSMLDGF